MKTKENNDLVCPRCDYRLIPVYARKDHKREPIARCCPEPYCDYMLKDPLESPQSLREVVPLHRAG